MSEDEAADPLDQGTQPPFKRQREEVGSGTGLPLGGGLVSNSNRGGRPAARNYRCPACDGEFNSWDKVISNPKEAGGIDLTRQAANRKAVCPFCGLERRSYEPEKSDGGE